MPRLQFPTKRQALSLNQSRMTSDEIKMHQIEPEKGNDEVGTMKSAAEVQTELCKTNPLIDANALGTRTYDFPP